MIKFGFLTVLYLYYSSDKPEATGGLFLPALMAQLERSTGVREREWPGMTFLVAALGGLKFTGRFPRCRAAYTLGAAAAIHPSIHPTQPTVENGSQIKKVNVTTNFVTMEEEKLDVKWRLLELVKGQADTVQAAKR